MTLTTTPDSNVPVILIGAVYVHAPTGLRVTAVDHEYDAAVARPRAGARTGRLIVRAVANPAVQPFLATAAELEAFR
jgi:hypothetical protein